MNINFYVKRMGSFIILSAIWYERLIKCYLLHTDPSEFREFGEDMPSNMLSFINFEP